ncbi:MAG: LacI family DNA-binding transcriptional regulator [Anaerolineae bacterium]|nr:LacI family DNA-binding transcriptional regulator [Anaerolineae bacterium]
MVEHSITIQEVAKRAGVSQTTVSRVLNNKDEITAETRARVIRAIEQLGYVPNPIARGLVTNHTAMIGFVVSDITNPFLADVARGILHTAASHHYSLSIFMTENEPQREVQAIRFLISRRVDGLIVTPRESDEGNRLILNMAAHGHPFVLIGRHVSHPRVSTVSTSTAAGAYKATSYLLSLGHRRIAHIQASPRMGYGRGKLRGYTEALQEYGLQVDPDLIVASDFSIEDGQRASERLLRLSTPPTAIFATNDLTAIGAIMAIEAAGLRIPEDLSVVGFDDIIFARSTRPPLTTVSQPALKIGEAAAETLLQMIRTPNMPTQEMILDCDLVIRQSTSPPRSR